MVYASLANVALRLIEKYGKTAVLESVTTTVRLEQPVNPIQMAEPRTVKIVTVPTEQKYLDGDILITDIQAYIAASGLDVPVRAKDFITINNNTFRIIKLIPYRPGEVTIIYVVFLRK